MNLGKMHTPTESSHLSLYCSFSNLLSSADHSRLTNQKQMKVFAGLVTIALAVTSSYADQSNYLRSTTHDDELDEVMKAGSNNPVKSFLEELADVFGSGSHFFTPELIADANKNTDVLTKKGYTDSFTQLSDYDDDDDLASGKSKWNNKVVNVKGDDTELEYEEDDESGSTGLKSGQLVKDTNVKEVFTEDDDIISESTNVKSGNDNIEAKSTGEDLLEYGKSKSDTNVKTDNDDQFVYGEDLNDHTSGAKVKGGKYGAHAPGASDNSWRPGSVKSITNVKDEGTWGFFVQGSEPGSDGSYPNADFKPRKKVSTSFDDMVSYDNKSNGYKLDYFSGGNFGTGSNDDVNLVAGKPMGIRTGGKQYYGADDIDTVTNTKSARNVKESLDKVNDDDDDEDSILVKGHKSKGKKLMSGEEDMTQDMQQTQFVNDQAFQDDGRSR